MAGGNKKKVRSVNTVRHVQTNVNELPRAHADRMLAAARMQQNSNSFKIKPSTAGAPALSIRPIGPPVPLISGMHSGMHTPPMSGMHTPPSQESAGSHTPLYTTSDGCKIPFIHPRQPVIPQSKKKILLERRPLQGDVKLLKKGKGMSRILVVHNVTDVLHLCKTFGEYGSIKVTLCYSPKQGTCAVVQYSSIQEAVTASCLLKEQFSTYVFEFAQDPLVVVQTTTLFSGQSTPGFASSGSSTPAFSGSSTPRTGYSSASSTPSMRFTSSGSSTPSYGAPSPQQFSFPGTPNSYSGASSPVSKPRHQTGSPIKFSSDAPVFVPQRLKVKIPTSPVGTVGVPSAASTPVVFAAPEPEVSTPVVNRYAKAPVPGSIGFAPRGSRTSSSPVVKTVKPKKTWRKRKAQKPSAPAIIVGGIDLD